MDPETMDLVVETPFGAVRGLAEANGTISFRGLPFAAPPVGALRWRHAQPPAPWQGTRDATRFAPLPVQGAQQPDGIMAQYHIGGGTHETSEDCLYLNIWTPKPQTDALLPVIVFLPGGGHRYLNAGADVSHGAALAARGAVVVTVAYRVGALGYLAHPDLAATGETGNQSLSDVIAALEWVRDAIAGFGGDPKRVTVMGHSAGAAHVSALMAAPRAKRLFLRAVALSGGRFHGGPLGQAAPIADVIDQGAAYCDSFGASTPDDLPPEALMHRTQPWRIAYGDSLLPDSIDAAFASKTQAKTPVLLGFTGDDGTAFPNAATQTPEGFAKTLSDTFPPDIAAQLAEFYQSEDDPSYAFERDRRFAYQVMQFARRQRQAIGPQVMLFRFDHKPTLRDGTTFSQTRPKGGYGAYHGAELWYLFQNLDKSPFQITQTDRDLSDRMAAALIAFARTGDPNYARPGSWPPFGYGNLPRLAMHFDGTDHVAPLTNQTALDLLNAHFNDEALT